VVRHLRALACSIAAAACGGGGASGEDGTATAHLTWQATPSPEVIGYRVYYGVASRRYLQRRGEGIQLGRDESYIVTGLNPGTVYYFAVTAFDIDFNESAYSNEATNQPP
jgi:Fibronectin type III domain